MTIRLAWLLMMLALAAPSLAHAQTLGQGDAIELPLLRLVIGLFLCSVLAIAAAIVLKRFMRGSFSLNAPKSGMPFLTLPTRKVRVLETQRISPHADICVFTCARRQYVVVVSPGAATIVREDAITEGESTP